MAAYLSLCPRVLGQARTRARNQTREQQDRSKRVEQGYSFCHLGLSEINIFLMINREDIL